MANDEASRGGSEEQSPFATEVGEEIDLMGRPYDIYQCEDCNNVVLVLHGCDDNISCHGEPMEPVADVQLNVDPPNLRDVLLQAFGLPKVGIDICLCVIDEGPLSPSEVAEILGYEESTIRRYLNQLADVGLLTKHQLNREDGGFVTVYQPIGIDEMRNESLVAFYAWAGEAATLIEEANLTKEDYLDADHPEQMTDVFWESFQDGRADES